VSPYIRLELGPPSPKIDVRAAGVPSRSHLARARSVGRPLDDAGRLGPSGRGPSEAAAREVREESGIVCTPRKLIAVLDRNKHPHGPFNQSRQFQLRANGDGSKNLRLALPNPAKRPEPPPPKPPELPRAFSS
jgi:hypothetical protein